MALSISLLAAACGLPTSGSTLQEAPATAPRRVLVVMSGADHIRLQSGKDYDTGYFVRELTDPAQRLLAAGYELEFASPGGAAPTIDTNSLELVWYYHPNPLDFIYARGRRTESLNLARSLFGTLQFNHKDSSADVAKVVSDIEAAQIGATTKPILALADVQDLSQYSAVLVPGGHAPMTDLIDDPDMGRILRHFHAAHKPTALICHAPIALLSAREEGQPWIYAGYRVTAASKLEEKLLESFGPIAGDRVAYYVDMELQRAGAKLDQTLIPGGRRVSVDRELVSGQSPSSAAEMGDKLVQALALYSEGVAMGDTSGWWTRRDLSPAGAEPLPASLVALKAGISKDIAEGKDAVARLDTLFKDAATRAEYLQMPQGDAVGVPLFAGVLAESVPGANEIAGMVWGGKIFKRQSAEKATLVNKVLGLPLIRANVYPARLAATAIDDAQSIVLDYGVAEFAVARTIRDEIRQIGPGLYLGRATMNGVFVTYFALQFQQ